MKTLLSKIASVLAFIIGGMAIFAGGKVLLGNMPDYYVINWVPVYNFGIGLVSVFLLAALIWKNSKHAVTAAITTLGLHSIVMVVLQTAYRDVVALDSIRAMTIRITAWIVITALVLVQSWISKNVRGDKALEQRAHR